jgi:hypothetical protein
VTLIVSHISSIAANLAFLQFFTLNNAMILGYALTTMTRSADVSLHNQPQRIIGIHPI